MLNKTKISGLISVYLAVIGWAFTGVLGKSISVNASSIIWWRLFLCVVILISIFYRKIYVFYKIRFNQFKLAVLSGVILYFHWIGFYQSIKLANVSIGVVCLSVIPFFTCFVQYWLQKKKIHLSQLLLSILVVVCLMFTFGFEYQYRSGIIIGLIGAVIDAFYVVLCDEIIKEEKPQHIITVQFSSAFIVHTLFIFLSTLFFSHTHIVHVFYAFNFLQGNDYWWWLILSIPCTLGSFYLALNSLKVIPVFTQTIILSFEPIMGIALGVLIFREHEQLSHYFYMGIIGLFLLVAYQTIKTYYANKKM